MEEATGIPKQHVNPSAKAYLNPQTLVNRFALAQETGSLSVPSTLAAYAAQYQEHARAFEEVVLTKPLKYFNTDDAELDEDRVLIPISGGFSSAACVWYALQRGWTPFLLHFVGEQRGAKRSQMAVKEIAVGARDARGFPLCDRVANRIESRLIVVDELGVPSERGVASEQGAPSEDGAPSDFSFSTFAQHPLGALAMHIEATRIALKRKCKRVLWGGHWTPPERNLALALCDFTSHLVGIESSFPYETRADVYAALQEAAEQSAALTLGNLRTASAVLCERPMAMHACHRASDREFAQRQAELPRPFENVCGNCAECAPWIELALEGNAPLFCKVLEHEPVAPKKSTPKRSPKEASVSKEAPSNAKAVPAARARKAAPKRVKRAPTKRKPKASATITGDAELDKLLDF